MTQASAVPTSGVGTMILPSRYRAPAARACRARARASSGVEDVRLTTVVPLSAPPAAWNTASTAPRSSTHTTVTGDAATAAATLGASVAPAMTRSPARPGERFQTVVG